jgi:hypothetical protein
MNKEGRRLFAIHLRGKHWYYAEIMTDKPAFDLLKEISDRTKIELKNLEIKGVQWMASRFDREPTVIQYR